MRVVFYVLRGPMCRVITVLTVLAALVICQVAIRTDRGSATAAAFSAQLDDSDTGTLAPDTGIDFAGWRPAPQSGRPKTASQSSRLPAPPAIYSRTASISLPIRC